MEIPDDVGTFLAALRTTGAYDPGAAPPGVIARREGFRLEQPFDARRLAELWGMARPIAVSTDVHQRSWWLFARGRDLEDPYAHRVAAEPVVAGALTLHARLTGRPPGPLPDLVAGASPAYDVLEVGGLIDLVEVRR